MFATTVIGVLYTEEYTRQEENYFFFIYDEQSCTAIA